MYDSEKGLSALLTLFEEIAAVYEERWKRFKENWVVYEDQWLRLGREITGAKGKVDGLQQGELLATIGWILPEEMSFRELAHLVLECDDLTIQRVDDFFIDYYDRDGRVEFLNLKARLTSSSQLSNWRPLVEQTVSAFERGDYAICVPSLLLMIEGVIRVQWRVEVRKARDCAKFFERKIEITGPKTPDDCEAWVLQSRWRSIRAFVENVFGEASDREQYPMPKRHLILHGKSDPAQWDRADCLRLFQAISMIAWFGETF